MKCSAAVRGALLLWPIVGLALALRYEDVLRETRYHPDERAILRWMEAMRERGEIGNPAYPGGYFVLAEAGRRVWDHAAYRPWQSLRKRLGLREGPRPSLDTLVFGRHFNVWLSVVTLVPVFLVGLRASRSLAPAAAAALLFACAPRLIEHARYLETDTAAVAALALALWLWVRWRERETEARCALASLATGFAAGTKYTAAPLAICALLWVMARGIVRARSAEPGRRWREIIPLPVAVAALMAGFLCAVPAALDFDRYLESFRVYGGGVIAERAGFIGAARNQSWAGPLLHARIAAEQISAMGTGWGILAATGFIVLIALRRWRPFGPLTILFPALTLYIIIFQSPFFRAQEWMPLLPSLACAAAAALGAWMDLARRIQRRGWATLAGWLPLLLILPTARMGVGTATQCGWADTRDIARGWFRRHIPETEAIAFEDYAWQAAHRAAGREINIGKIERGGEATAVAEGSRFLIRNALHRGRGAWDPFSGGLYPEMQARWGDYVSRSERIRSWSAIRPERPRVIFRSPALELWSLSAPAPGPDLRLSLPRPAWISDAKRPTFFRDGHSLAVSECVPLSPDVRRIALGGPEEIEGPVYLVIHSERDPATVRIRGRGRRVRVSLDADDARAVALSRPAWLPRWARFERISMRVERPDGATAEGCGVRVAFSADEAAHLLMGLGRADRADELLEREPSTDPALRLRAAVEAGRLDRAASLAVEAGAHLRHMRAWLGAGSERRIGGISLAVRDEVSRLRLAQPGQWRLEAGAQGSSEDGAQSEILWPVRLHVPVRVRVEFQVSVADDAAARPERIIIQDSAGSVLARVETAGGGDARHTVEFEYPAARVERVMATRWIASRPCELVFDRVEITWNTDGLVEEELRQGEAAMAVLHAHRAPPVERRSDGPEGI
ncbi:MAG: phospholipid carrier-dependent glycosyltransferase [Kiritimatiellae bacterium]|nr:phospholipid carrier-dependent glycosyltransferase [Kiritimatiellia bacterium]